MHTARYRIETNAAEDMAKQKVLHQLWAINTKNEQKINQIRHDIQEDQLKVSSLLATRRNEIERYEFEKQRLCHKNSMVLNRLMYVYGIFMPKNLATYFYEMEIQPTMTVFIAFINFFYNHIPFMKFYMERHLACPASNQIKLWLKYAILANAIKLPLLKQ